MEFIRQPIPRPIPKKIARAYVGGGSLFVMVWGGLASLFGLPFFFGSFAAAPGDAWTLRLIGLGVFAFGATIGGLASRYRRRRYELLRNGKLALGLVESVRDSGMEVNNLRRHIATIQFSADGAETVAKISVYGRHTELAHEALESHEAVSLLYDPRQPTRCLLAFQLTPAIQLQV